MGVCLRARLSVWARTPVSARARVREAGETFGGVCLMDSERHVRGKSVQDQSRARLGRLEQRPHRAYDGLRFR